MAPGVSINLVVPEGSDTFTDDGSAPGLPCSTLFVLNLPHTPHSLSADFSWQGRTGLQAWRGLLQRGLPPVLAILDRILSWGWVYLMWPHSLPRYHQLKPVFGVWSGPHLYKL